MTTKDLMFALIRSEIFDLELPQDAAALIDAEMQEKLYRLSKEHDMAHVVASAIEKCNLPQERRNEPILAKLQKEQMLAFYRYQTTTYELGAICSCLEAGGIDFIPLKGSVLRQYYTQPWMRTSCDIDILVRPEVLDRATDLLVQSLGYQKGTKNFHNISLYTQSGVHIELHFDLIEEMRHPTFIEVLKRAWEDASPMEGTQHHMLLSNEFFYFYHVAHMVKHFEEGGCGIRPFLDLLILNRHLTYDAAIKEDLLRQGSLTVFDETARALSGVWFEGLPHTELTQMTEQFIISGGVYGNMENKVAVQQQKKGGKLHYVMAKIFPPYRTLKLQYPILKKHCYLMPVFIVVRWFRWLFGKNAKRTASEFSMNRSISDEKVNAAAELCRRLGL